MYIDYKSKSVINREFSRRLNHLRRVFPAAFRFLTYLEKNSPRVWFGTSSNMHLYKGDCYLLRVVLSRPESRQPYLLLQKTPHMGIYEGTIDRSDQLFIKRLSVLIDRRKGFDDGWAEWENSDSIKITSKTPEKFFNDLVDEIAATEC